VRLSRGSLYIGANASPAQSSLVYDPAMLVSEASIPDEYLLNPKVMGLSAIVICKNEASQIERCIRSLAFAQEVVVVDSGSTDDTVAIARALGARVTVTDWPGYGAQNNRAMDLAQGPWVLSIDADEWPDSALVAALRDTIASATNTGPVAYRFRRKNFYAGKLIRFGDWSGDWALKLLHKDYTRFKDEIVHPGVSVNGTIANLNGGLWHDSIADYAEAWQKYDTYARLSAIEKSAKGNGGLLPALLHGSFAGLRAYVLKLGVLDGVRGLQLAWLGARYTFLKYYRAGRLIKSASEN
jgi:glycosyltransferase involved in cell wall biosynthesis